MQFNILIFFKNIKNIAKFSALPFTVLLALCFATASFAVIPQEGGTYFTKHNIFFEKGRHVTTNYSRGDLLPVNTKVTVVKIGSRKMVIDSKYGRVTLKNVKKHTKKTMEDVADRFLSTQPRKVSGRFAKDIQYGELRLGMTKRQAIITRGYPPAHKTYSTEADRWTYWTSKFVHRSLIFENNRLVRGRGLR